MCYTILNSNNAVGKKKKNAFSQWFLGVYILSQKVSAINWGPNIGLLAFYNTYN